MQFSKCSIQECKVQQECVENNIEKIKVKIQKGIWNSQVKKYFSQMKTIFKIEKIKKLIGIWNLEKILVVGKTRNYCASSFGKLFWVKNSFIMAVKTAKKNLAVKGI